LRVGEQATSSEVSGGRPEGENIFYYER